MVLRMLSASYPRSASKTLGTGRLSAITIEAEIVRRLARRDLRSHGQAVRVDEKVELGRETTTRTAKTLSQRPLFEPAA